MNYITSVNQDMIHNKHTYPKIYNSKPDKLYMKTNADKEMLDLFFRSNTFAWLFYLEASSLFLSVHDYNYYKKMPFSYVLNYTN